MNENEEARGAIQSVERAARILSIVADAPGDPLSLGDLARVLDVHRSTVSRLVGTLVRTGLLEGGGNGPVRLGPELRRIARLADGDADLADLAAPAMDRLAAETGETVTLSVRDADHAVTIAQSEGTHRIGVRSWVGARTPLAKTADGKVLLAFTTGSPAPSQSLPSQSLERELSRVRHDEWAAARGDLEQNLNGVAVPLFRRGTCIAALCVCGPSYRVTPDDFPRLADLCRRTACAITDRHLELT